MFFSCITTSLRAVAEQAAAEQNTWLFKTGNGAKTNTAYGFSHP